VIQSQPPDAVCIISKQADELLDAVGRTFTRWEKKIERRHKM
jgi:hypothetical protein